MRDYRQNIRPHDTATMIHGKEGARAPQSVEGRLEDYGRMLNYHLNKFDKMSAQMRRLERRIAELEGAVGIESPDHLDVPLYPGEKAK